MWKWNGESLEMPFYFFFFHSQSTFILCVVALLLFFFFYLSLDFYQFDWKNDSKQQTAFKHHTILLLLSFSEFVFFPSSSIYCVMAPIYMPDYNTNKPTISFYFIYFLFMNIFALYSYAYALEKRAEHQHFIVNIIFIQKWSWINF